MRYQALVAPLVLAAVLVGLTGCAFKSATPPPAAEDPLAAGTAAFERKDYATACQELTKASGAEAQYKAGVSCLRDGREKAERAFKTALAADAKYAPAMEGMGLAALAAGDLTRARDMLESAARSGGTDPQAALALGDLYLLEGRCDVAVAAFQSAVQHDPSLGEARTRLAAARTLCAARRAAPSGRAASGGNAVSGHAAPAASAMPGPASSSGGREQPKPKAGPKTIDLNDI